MTFGSTDNIICAHKTPATMRRTPAQLEQGVLSFMTLAKSHPDLPPAILAAVLACSSSEQPRLLEAARQGLGLDQQVSPSSDCGDAWEDAVQDLVFGRKMSAASRAGISPVRGHAAGLASAPTDSSTEMARLEIEVVECRRRWQQTRQLPFWTRYNECRNRIAELRGCTRNGRAEREDLLRSNSRLSHLDKLREVHEQRLADIKLKRERLRLTKHYDTQTRQHHAQLAATHLQDELRRLDEVAQLRRRQHQNRVQQLMMELATDDPRTDAPKPKRPEADAEFTHEWDDFSYWEDMVNDDKELTLSNPPDLIPVVPEGPWARTASNPQRRGGGVGGFDERKKWFEQALLSWHAQNEDEDLGAWPSEPLGRPQSTLRLPWVESTWSAVQRLETESH